MNSRLFVPGLATAFALALLSGISRAAESKAEAENPEEFSRVRGLFDVDLPKTVEKFKAKVTVHPHFGDFLHRDYLRIPVGLRLGISDRTEINAEVESYVTHGLKKTGDGFGLDLIHVGAKHQLTQG